MQHWHTVLHTQYWPLTLLNHDLTSSPVRLINSKTLTSIDCLK